jgi:hypothetical protein
VVIDLNSAFISPHIIFNMISFSAGFILCCYRINKKIDSQNRLEAEKEKLVQAPLSNDPMIFQFHLMENSEYALQAYGVEGRHLNKKNHGKFMQILRFLYENEKLRPLPPEHHFKLLKFEKKD